MPKHIVLGRALLCASFPLYAAPAFAAELASDTSTDNDAVSTAPLVITVTAPTAIKDSRKGPASATFVSDPMETSSPVLLETGEYLRSVPGVTSARAGGHGFEPVIRGQQQNQLTVIDNGAQVFGACPGRMDPPTSLARPGAFDRVTVIRGYQTVTNGPGAAGGTIILDSLPPDTTTPVSGSVWGGVESNGGGTSTGFSVTGSQDGFYATGDASWIRADDYEDGNGKDVRSAFTQVGGGFTLGYVDPDGSFLEGNISKDTVRDAHFNGMMDSSETDTIAGRVNGMVMVGGDVLESIEASFYANNVDHLMDNYSLRDVTGMYMKTDARSRTFGGKLAANLDLFGTDTVIGIDGRSNNRQALGYMGMSSNLDRIRTYSWPDITINEVGLFGESTIPVAENTRLVAGARLDFVYTTAGAADDVPGMAVMGEYRTANSLYTDYYGTTYDDRLEVNAGGLLRVEHDIQHGITLNAGISRAVRTADATERGIASGYGASARVGNPDINPEKHHQIDIGASWQGLDGSSAYVAGYVNWVDDYIVADRARGEYGVLRSDGALIYHNTDAFISGIELGARKRFLENWTVDADMAWTYGQDLDAGRPLAQIPPLSMGVGVTYDGGGWTIGGKVRGALTQTRADTDPTTGTGQDVQETPGWVTMDLQATITDFEPFEIGLGVTNLFDANYAEHLNKAAVFEPEDIQVNEPGRSFYLKTVVRF